MSVVGSVCPVCEADEPRPWLDVLGCRLVRCPRCGTGYVHSAATAEASYGGGYFGLAEARARTTYQVGYIDYAADRRAWEANFRRYVGWLARQAPPPGRLLEVGCAHGFFLACARELGYQVQGLDVSPEAVAWMRSQLGIAGRVGLLSDLEPGETFDVIAACEVIEHLPQPKEFLRQVRERLRPGGYVALATGDASARLARLLGRRWWYVNPPSHCVYYTRASLRRLLEAEGFRVVDQRRVAYNVLGLRNLGLKALRMTGLLDPADPDPAGVALLRRLPNLRLPVFHGTTQFLVARA